MAVLGAGLAREEHKLLGADTVCVDVDHQLQTGALELVQAEVGYFDVSRFFGSQRDPDTGEIFTRLPLGPIKLFSTDHMCLLLFF
jgi:hypothetical protein